MSVMEPQGTEIFSPLQEGSLEYRWLKYVSIIWTAILFSAKDRVLLCPHVPFKTGFILFKRTSCIASFSFDRPTNLIFNCSIFVIVT